MKIAWTGSTSQSSLPDTPVGTVCQLAMLNSRKFELSAAWHAACFNHGMKQLWISILLGTCVIACSSGGEGAGNVGGAAGSNTGGSGGASGGSGGGSGGSCPNECFAPAQCVHQCGEQPVEYGCCGCPPGMIDANQCADDAGCHPSIPDAGSITCGASTCTANQICVFHCCGGAPVDGSACKPAPPTCVDTTEISCTPCDGTSSCNAPSEGCSGTLVGQSLDCVCG